MWKKILLALLVTAPASHAASAPAPEPQCVVLLHGLMRTEYSMMAVAWRLEEAGYTVANITYPSLTRPIPELAQLAVTAGLSECRARDLWRYHFVTHSLGGILLREYLDQAEIDGLERVVMLGPPNQGSRLADYVQGIDFLQPVAPQAIAQLGTGESSVPRSLGPVEFELGVIAGTASALSPLPWVLDGPSDGTVTVEETRVAGMVDFIALDASHSFIMWNSEVLDQVLFFLRQGHFDHSPAEPPRPPYYRPPSFSPRSGR